MRKQNPERRNDEGRHRLGRLLFPGIYNEGTGENKPLPEGGAKLFFYLLGTYFFKLIALNLLTLVLCLPVITIPASLSALSRVMMKLAMQGYCSVYEEYFGEWKSALLRYLPFFFLSALPAAAGIVLVYTRFASLSGLGGFAIIAICALVFFFVYLLWCYAFPLFSMIDLPVWQNVRNAMFFVATQRKANLKLLLPILLVCVCLVFLPWTVPFFALVLLSFSSLMICCIVKPPIDEHVIRPYQEKAEESASNNQQGE